MACALSAAAYRVQNQGGKCVESDVRRYFAGGHSEEMCSAAFHSVATCTWALAVAKTASSLACFLESSPALYELLLERFCLDTDMLCCKHAVHFAMTLFSSLNTYTGGCG